MSQMTAGGKSPKRSNASRSEQAGGLLLLPVSLPSAGRISAMRAAGRASIPKPLSPSRTRAMCSPRRMASFGRLRAVPLQRNIRTWLSRSKLSSRWCTSSSASRHLTMSSLLRTYTGTSSPTARRHWWGALVWSPLPIWGHWRAMPRERAGHHG